MSFSGDIQDDSYRDIVLVHLDHMWAESRAELWVTPEQAAGGLDAPFGERNRT